MSMAVDLSTPLTPEERAYLNERGRYAEIERADALHGGTPDDAPTFGGDGTGPRVQQLNTGLATIEEPEVLLQRLRDMGVNVQVLDEDDDSEVAPYTEWSITDLKTEIDRRNEGRDEASKLSKSGSVQTLADRLYKDDDAVAGTEQ